MRGSHSWRIGELTTEERRSLRSQRNEKSITTEERKKGNIPFSQLYLFGSAFCVRQCVRGEALRNGKVESRSGKKN